MAFMRKGSPEKITNVVKEENIEIKASEIKEEDKVFNKAGKEIGFLHKNFVYLSGKKFLPEVLNKIEK